jgi:hypothetical protein
MLTVPVIVSKNIKLKAFEPLCHISFVPITFALGSIKGKLYIYYSSFYSVFFISNRFFSVFFSVEDELYFSEDEEYPTDNDDGDNDEE